MLGCRVSPPLQALGRVEEWTHGSTFQSITVVRSLVTRAITFVVLLLATLQISVGEKLCWEDEVGQMIYKLFVIKTLLEVWTSLASDFFLGKLYRAVGIPLRPVRPRQRWCLVTLSQFCGSILPYTRLCDRRHACLPCIGS